MNITKVLNQAHVIGTQIIDSLRSKDIMERLATKWLTALVKDAQENPVEFVTHGASVPPWIVFDQETVAFARNHMKELASICNNQLEIEGSCHRIFVTGTCLTIR